MTNHEAAIFYAIGGWHVFPIVDKTPLIDGGFLNATTDVSTVHGWWKARPDASIGVACRASGLIVIDVDVAGNKEGDKHLAGLEEQWGPLPRECWAQSARNGTHIIMANPSPGADGWTRNRDEGGLCRGQITNAIDVKNNGYIVVEPSPGYTWKAHTFDVPPMPESWQALIKHDVEAGVGPGVEAWQYGDDLTKDVLKALEQHLELLTRGEGNSSTFKAIKAVFHDWSLSIDTGWPLIQIWNAHCGKPHTEAELSRQVCRVADREMTSPRGWCRHAEVERENTIKTLSAVAVPKKPPTKMTLKATLEASAKRLSRRTRPESLLEGKLLRSVLKGESLEDEDLVSAARACWKYAPPETEPMQLAEVLTASARTAQRAIELVDVVPQSSVVLHNPQSSGKIRDPQGFELDAMMQRKSTPENTELALQKLKVSLSYDLFSDEILINRGGDEETLNDKIANALWFEIDRDFMFRPLWDVFNRQLDDCSFRAAFHPVRDYLDSLEWDGTPRVDNWLAVYGGADDTPFVKAVGAIVLIAAARRVRQPGCKFDEMLILEDPNQGTNKSTALAILAVKEKWFGDDLPLGASSKEQMEALSGHWIMEAGELKGMRRGEVHSLKGFLSRTVDKARLSYARRTTSQPRQCVIIGTTNDSSYLKDGTGNRRFWPVRVRGFDVKALRRDRDQLWAEASAREQAGDSIRLREDLWAVATQEQEERRVDDPIEEMLGELLNSAEGVIPSTTLWRALGFEQTKPNQDHIRRRGAALARLGWERVRVRRAGGRHYAYAKGDSKKWLVAKKRYSENGSQWVVQNEKIGLALVDPSDSE